MIFNQKTLTKYKLNIKIAFDAVLSNKVRTILTGLGIIFGVAAVIAMLAIGNGAKKELLDQMKLVGVNNIIITPKIEKNKQKSNSDDKKEDNENNLSAGLTLKDAEAIKRIIPSVKQVSPEVTSEQQIVFKKNSISGNFTGITNSFFDVYNLELSEGKFFNNTHYQKGEQVCIIGYNVAIKLFPTENPIGKQIKCGGLWLKVIGVLKNRLMDDDQMTNLQIDNFNLNIYAPIQTALLRYNDRSVINSSKLKKSYNEDEMPTDMNSNQLDKLIVQIDESENISTSLNIIQRLLKRRHINAEDFIITVPELLLKQEQKTRNIFNIVLAAIASISLIVGGIGIMNIMLASVLERIKEIGLRRAIGARQEDVVLQFIAEATIISVSGGIIGIILGITLAILISQFTEITTIVSAFSIFVSFFVSVGVGILFGYMPAKKAALQDPVTSLRHE